MPRTLAMPPADLRIMVLASNTIESASKKPSKALSIMLNCSTGKANFAVLVDSETT